MSGKLPGQYGFDVDAGAGVAALPSDDELAAEAARHAFDKRWWDGEASESEREAFIQDARDVLSHEPNADVDPDFRREVLAYVAGARRKGRREEPMAEAETPVVNQTLTAEGDLEARLLAAFDRGRDGFAGPSAYRDGLRAVLSELAAMGGEALPDAVAIAAVLEDCGLRSAYAEDFGEAVAKMNRARVAPILAAQAATMAEQARENEWLTAKVDQLEGDRHDLRGMYRRALDGADTANMERDAAIAEVARLKAETEALRKRVRILEIAPKAAHYANHAIGSPYTDDDARLAAEVIEAKRCTVDGLMVGSPWAKAVLEYAAREGLA